MTPASASTTSATRPRVWLILLALLAISLALRTHQLTRTSFWTDEVASVAIASGHWQPLFSELHGYYEHAPDLASETALRPWWTIWFETDFHPPLHFFALRIWWSLFGMSDASGRSLSVVCSVLAVIVLFDTARLVLGNAPALWAAAILAVSPTQIRYAQEARGYSMVMLLGLLACNALLRIDRLGPNVRRYVALGLFSTAALMTHYYVIGAILGLTSFALLRLRGRARWISAAILLGGLLPVIARLPITLAHLDENKRAIAWMKEDADGLIPRTLARVAAVPMWLLIEPRDSAMTSGAPAVLLLFFPIFLERRRPGLILAAIWAGGVISMVAAADIVFCRGGLQYVRYTLAAAPMICLSAVAIGDAGGKWIRHTLPALIVAGAVLSIPGMFQTLWGYKPDLRTLGNDVRSHLKADDILVVASRPDMGDFSAGREYIELSYYAWPIPCPVVILDSPADSATLEKIRSHRRIWVVECNYLGALGQTLGNCTVVEPLPVRNKCGRLERVELPLAQ